ncbi:MAG TPA: 3' terminal RNA ribose 2'-O-methyltransferase Hen1 [Candidatus Angelobacter sp.]|nr:3' terminal RNA ribose 2'-O-methyltransferase Hen1 [Candidatus Angelobacter sp.]
MLLTITTTHAPATDLGYLLHKNPARVHSFELSFGKVHIFYPEATADRCSAALLLDVDAVGLVRGKGGPRQGGTLDQYVNDRPYVLSSFLSVAMGRALGTAMTGRSKDRQELAEQPITLTATLAVVSCRSGESLLRELFEPLGYKVTAERHPLDEKFPEWGEGPYYRVTLEGTVRLQDLLNHLYVLVPVLDAEKHYWIGKDEVDKLLRKGEGWLASHPHKETIVHRYLPRQRHLAREALSRLAEEDNPDPDSTAEANSEEEVRMEEPIRLWQQRMGAVTAVLRSVNAKRVIDLGCGEGKLLRTLLDEKSFTEILGMDVSYRSLEIANRRLRLDRLPPKQKERIRLIHGSLMYRDKRLAGYDAATVVEVIEHLDPPRLAAFERVLFESARPKTVIITTPNAEYNVRFETLPAGQFRHKDHRFEWTREQFQQWSRGMSERFGYTVRFLPVGEEDPQAGAPTQMGVFSL